MKITLVRPSTVVSVRDIRPVAVPPLGVAYLAGALRAAGHEVTAVDGVGEALTRVSAIPGVSGLVRFGLSDEDIAERLPAGCDLVGVSCMFSTEWPMVRRLIQRIRERRPDVRIIAGGEHVTACPEYVLADCPQLDWCGRGEGEGLMVDVVDTLAKGGDPRRVPGIVFRNGHGCEAAPGRPRLLDIDSIPLPAWDVFPILSYIDQGAQAGVELGRTIPLLCSRGCPYECTFCSSPRMWGTTWKARDPEKVLAEMKRYMAAYDVTNFDIYDLTMIVRKDWIVQMANRIIDSGLTLTWQLPSGTRSEVIDADVATLLYRSGCRHAIYAPESGSERMLKLIKKKVKKDRMVASVRAAARAGIVTKANFIVGFPDERLRDVMQSYGFSLQLALAGMNEVSFFAFSPYPGAELYDRLQAEGRVSLSDAHFNGLLTNARSFSELIPDWALPLLRWTGVGSFFMVSFLVRPWRVLALLADLGMRRPRTRLSSAILRIARRWLLFLRSGAFRTPRAITGPGPNE